MLLSSNHSNLQELVKQKEYVADTQYRTQIQGAKIVVPQHDNYNKLFLMLLAKESVQAAHKIFNMMLWS